MSLAFDLAKSKLGLTGVNPCVGCVIVGKDEKILVEAAKDYGLDPKKDMWRLPALFVGQYAERDAESTLKLWKRLETELYKE